MPIIEFQCDTTAEHKFERIVSWDTKGMVCPTCGGGATKVPSALSNYYIRGNNSASTRPKRGLNRGKS